MVKKLYRFAIDQTFKGVVNWLENYEKAQKGSQKYKTKGKRSLRSVKKEQNRPKGGSNEPKNQERRVQNNRKSSARSQKVYRMFKKVKEGRSYVKRELKPNK